MAQGTFDSGRISTPTPRRCALVTWWRRLAIALPLSPKASTSTSASLPIMMRRGPASSGRGSSGAWGGGGGPPRPPPAPPESPPTGGRAPPGAAGGTDGRPQGQGNAHAAGIGEKGAPVARPEVTFIPHECEGADGRTAGCDVERQHGRVPAAGHRRTAIQKDQPHHAGSERQDERQGEQRHHVWPPLLVQPEPSC